MGDNPVKVRILLAAPCSACHQTMKTSIQDDAVIQSIWDNDLSLLEVWKAYKSAYLVESLTFKEATASDTSITSEIESSVTNTSNRWVGS